MIYMFKRYFGGITNINTENNFVCLTFDDGPNPENTQRVLDILSKYEVKATFFVVVKLAEKYQFLIKEMVEAGHDIGNHT